MWLEFRRVLFRSQRALAVSSGPGDCGGLPGSKHHAANRFLSSMTMFLSMDLVPNSRSGHSRRILWAVRRTASWRSFQGDSPTVRTPLCVSHGSPSASCGSCSDGEDEPLCSKRRRPAAKPHHLQNLGTFRRWVIRSLFRWATLTVQPGDREFPLEQHRVAKHMITLAEQSLPSVVLRSSRRGSQHSDQSLCRSWRLGLITARHRSQQAIWIPRNENFGWWPTTFIPSTTGRFSPYSSSRRFFSNWAVGQRCVYYYILYVPARNIAGL